MSQCLLSCSNKTLVLGSQFKGIQTNVSLPELVSCLMLVGSILGKVVDKV